MTTTENQTDSTYDAALASVRHAIRQFDGCSPEEREVLQADLDRLESMAEKLESGRLAGAKSCEVARPDRELIYTLKC